MTLGEITVFQPSSWRSTSTVLRQHVLNNIIDNWFYKENFEILIDYRTDLVIFWVLIWNCFETLDNVNHLTTNVYRNECIRDRKDWEKFQHLFELGKKTRDCFQVFGTLTAVLCTKMSGIFLVLTVICRPFTFVG